MATTKTFAGQSFNLPLNREPKSSDWGTQVSNFLISVADNAIAKTGGLFALTTADLNFGSSKGIILPYVTSSSANAASSGVVRVANNEGIGWKNYLNSANLILKVDTNNRLNYNSEVVPTISSTDSLTNKTLTDSSNHISASVLDSGTIPDARVPSSAVTQHVGSLAHQSLSGAGTNNHSTIDNHLANTSNPHSVTKAQVGLTNVDDTSDANKPVSTAQATAIGLKFNTADVDTDNTLTANSDSKVASQKAVKAYIASQFGANDAMLYKGVVNCSANPNYPAADAGHTYKISVAGKLGGASGVAVEVGDMAICTVDSSASGDQAAVGANWTVVQVNIDGAVVGPASCVSGNIPTFSGTSGKLIQDSGSKVADFATASNLSSHAGASVAHGVSGSVVGTTDSQTLTNKKLDGGTASTSNSWLLPQKSGESGPDAATASIYFDTSVNKVKAYYNSKWNAVGGGLTPVKATLLSNAFTATVGNLYIIDWADATNVNTDVTVTLPALTVGDAIEFVTVGNSTGTGRLLIAPNSADDIIYSGGTVDGASSDTLKLLPCEPAWIRLVGAVVNKWYTEGQAQFVSGTFAGNLAVTGLVTASAGISLGDSTLSVYRAKTGLTAGKFTGNSSSNQSGDVTVSYSKIGDVIFVTIPTFTFTADASDVNALFANTLPTGYRPSVDNYCPIVIRGQASGADYSWGAVRVNTDGTIRIYRNGGGDVFGAGTAGVARATTISLL